MEILFCVDCGSMLREGDAFCPKCGKAACRDGRAETAFLPKGVTKLRIRFLGNDVEDLCAELFEDLDKEIEPCADVAGEVEQCYIDGLLYAVKSGRISLSMLQRKLRVGYSKAGEIMKWMEENGFVSPYTGKVYRKVHCTKELFDKFFGHSKGSE